MNDFKNDEFKRKMQSALDVLAKEFSGLRTGRASTALLDPLVIEAYGSTMPLTQVGTVSIGDARLLIVQVWDKSMVKPVEKAIRESNLGLNPVVEGQMLRIPMPDLSQERRKELSKVAAKYAEQSKVAVRNIRRDAMDSLKTMEKKSLITEDQQQKFSKDIQTLTDDFIKKIDDMLVLKEKDILQIS